MVWDISRIPGHYPLVKFLSPTSISVKLEQGHLVGAVPIVDTYSSGLTWCSTSTFVFNLSPPGQNGRHFEDDIYRCILVNEKFWILNEISLKFVPKGVIDNKPALV